jgi:hypothetical protein
MVVSLYSVATLSGMLPLLWLSPASLALQLGQWEVGSAVRISTGAQRPKEAGIGNQRLRNPNGVRCMCYRNQAQEAFSHRRLRFT